MAYYPYLRINKLINNISLNKTERKRTAKNILKLKKQLNKDIPGKDIDKHLLLATWNIRDLGKNGPKQGFRNLEDLFYIAEIISAFDLVAVQEVNKLEEWEIVMDILGRDWDYIATDVSEYADGGNGERMTFVYDTRKVWFKNIAGEVVLSRTSLITEEIEIKEEDGRILTKGRQFARTPFIVSFQAGWFKFDLCTVHIYFGSESGAKLKRRIKEIQGIAEELAERAEILEKEFKSLILLGDFNIVHPEHETMKALKKEKFKIPKSIQKPANVKGDKYYDQIAIRTFKNDLIGYIDDDKSKNGGIFDLFGSIMKDNRSDYKSYKNRMRLTKEGEKCITEEDFKNYFLTWRTYHLSDHKPMWVKIPVDESQRYLQDLHING